MTKVAIWCRHAGDNIIGIGENIPWHVPSDTKKFWDMVKGENLVLGRKTYQTLPAEKYREAYILVLTSCPMFEVADKKKNSVVSDINLFKDFAEDLYIGGGASVYQAFLDSAPKLMPDVIVDCVYTGEIDTSVSGEVVEISDCVKIMTEKYVKISADFEKDTVSSAIYIRRGGFVEQKVLKKLLLILENQ